MQHYALTIGLPVYNAMPFLPEAIDSLLAQTVSNFEILVIVDGSKDESRDYLESIRDPRLRILVQENQGITATLNRMLQEASTPWLVRQDADDISYPHRVERLLEAIGRYPDAGMFYSLASYHPAKRSVGHFRCSQGTPKQLREIVQSGYLLSICHPSVALNIEKTLAIGGYRPLHHAEDADLWWRMALQYDIHLLPEVLIGFRQNAGSISARNAYAQELHGFYIQYLLLSHLSNQPALPLSTIAPLLTGCISDTRLEAKEQLRKANIYLAAGDYWNALSAFSRSVFTSPSYLFRRIRDEYFPAGCLVNGLPPEFFYRKKEAFWP